MCSTTVHRLQHVRKKVRHVGQRQVINPHFDLVNCYHADFDVELSLCSKNRILAAGYKKKNNNNTKFSAPERLRIDDFHPAVFFCLRNPTR